LQTAALHSAHIMCVITVRQLITMIFCSLNTII